MSIQHLVDKYNDANDAFWEAYEKGTNTNQLRSRACQDPMVGMLYAYHIDKKGHSQTRAIALENMILAKSYIQEIDGCIHPQIYQEKLPKIILSLLEERLFED